MKGILTKDDSRFPSKLLEEEQGMKAVYYEGDLNLLLTRKIAVVGSRSSTQYGRVVAKNIGRQCAEHNVTLVSGLAKGIDTAGHKGVMEAGGKTIAVLGGGTGYYYPAENKALQQKIAEEGLLLSLHEPDYKPRPYDFPIRNRIISSLSECVVVVEAGVESGALITAEDAADKGRTVYAVPGNITSRYSFGSNRLIRDRAEPLVCIEDIFTDMRIAPCVSSAEEVCEQLGEDEKKVFQVILQGGEVSVDEIYHKTDIKPSEINGIITILEMKGIIISALGKFLVAKF